MPVGTKPDQWRIAVIDDEPIVLREIDRGLSKAGFIVETFSDGNKALARSEKKPFDIVLTDLRMPGLSGLDILKNVKAQSPHTEVILITAYASVDSAIEAIRAGAYHYVVKPVKMAELKALINHVVEKLNLVHETEALKDALFSRSRGEGFIGFSRAMREVFRLIEKVAPLDCTVLIQGESGTGKEMVARALHGKSPRKDCPFVSFNCGAFNDDLIANELFGHEKGAYTGANETKVGLLEAADNGIVFLDEIGEMPMTMQVKLLRFLEERTLLRVGGTKPVEIDVRIVAASNQDLKEAVRNQTFREDLYYRLNVVLIDLPPLRSRKDDLPPLVNHFLKKYNRAFSKKLARVSDEAMALLSEYPYPGNVRELENIIERAVALADENEIHPRDLPSDLRDLDISSKDDDTWPTLEEKEREYIRQVLIRTDHKKGQAAEILGLPRTTLWRKMKQYGLE